MKAEQYFVKLSLIFTANATNVDSFVVSESAMRMK